MSDPVATRTQYGFDWGAAKVECLASDEKRGWVYLGVTTPKHRLEIYVTKTGRIRVYSVIPDGTKFEVMGTR